MADFWACSTMLKKDRSFYDELKGEFGRKNVTRFCLMK